MDIDGGAAEAPEELAREDLHVASQDEQVDLSAHQLERARSASGLLSCVTTRW
jgi:hypothetical protein